MKQTLSIVVSAYNEESSIGRCLESVKNFADEVVVVDNNSLDKTEKVAKKYTEKVIKRSNKLMLNINKNEGFKKATGDWILNLDADEVIPDLLAGEIRKRIQSNPKENGFWIKRKNFSFGKWIQHGLWWPDKQIRLFRRGKGMFPCEHIHEYVAIDGMIGELEEPYVHYNYESVHQYLGKIDRASTSEAISLTEAKYRISWYDAIRFPVSDFIKIYFAEKGYKDGMHGLVLALFQAFYSFCTFAKKWEMEHFPEQDIPLESVVDEMNRWSKEISYWTVTASMNDSHSVANTIVKKIQRKLLKLHI